MRILYITEGFPYPLTSGNLRHYHLIRGLSEHHEIELLSTVGGAFRPDHVDAMLPFCTDVETFRSMAGSSFVRKASGRARDIVVGGGSHAAGRALAAAAKAKIDRSTYDVIVLNGRITAPVIDLAGRPPVVVDLCDAPAPRLIGQLRYSSRSRRLMIRLKLRRLRATEARLIAAASHLLFASVRDRDIALSDAAAAPATVLPNGVDLDYWHRTSSTLGRDVVFSGAMHYPPNDDAARFLLSTIMPRVWESDAKARLHVIGLNPTEALMQAAADEPRAVVTGFVEDVRPHLEHGAVYAAPLRFASGIQNKLLEAMAMELPVVTSTAAAEGLHGDTVVALPLVVADTADEFASEVVAALDRARTDPEPRRAARAFVGDRFTWPEAVGILERVLATSRRAA